MPIEVMESYLRGDKLRTWPSLILISPAADIREPCRKEECWKDPDCLIPIYRLKLVSAT